MKSPLAYFPREPIIGSFLHHETTHETNPSGPSLARDPRNHHHQRTLGAIPLDRGCKLILYRCNGFRSVRALGIRDAAGVFAKRAARRAFGRRGIVRTMVEDSYTRNLSIVEFAAFIGYSTGPNETTGHNIRFTVIHGGAQ